jgi:5'-methylthioadenosine phosphorylase
MNDWSRRIREGDARALARAATGIENGDPQALALLGEIAPFTGHARIVGITGPPGAGKSTLVDALASALRRQGKTLAILAIDPTSSLTGGAILGDRIRMQRHYADAAVFIRSIATRGSLGGLAHATAGLVKLMDAAGKDYVIIETVGVGQAEIAIAGIAQVTVVVLVPGMGDDVQALKAGILEIADVFAINKSDQPGADRVERELQAMMGLADGRKPPIVKTVATDGAGIGELLESIRTVPVGHPGQERSPTASAAPSAGRRDTGVESPDQTIGPAPAGRETHPTQPDQTTGLAPTHRETHPTYSGEPKVKAEIGIIGGSGLYTMPGFEAAEEVVMQTPFGDPSDNYVLGTLAGRRVAFLSRHGRGHRISPSELNFRANIYGMKSLGVERIVSLSAVGSLKEEHRPLDFVIPDQFFDRTRGRISTFFGEGLVAHISFADPICPQMADVLAGACATAGVNARKGGTYLCMEGPAFSTKAESNVYRSWGMDVIGMTNLQEAKLAREAEICYVTVAMVTDYDCWHPQHDAVTVNDIIANLVQNAAHACAVVAAAVAALPAERTCQCGSALAHAILTDRAMVPQTTRQKLGILIDKYFV